MNESAARERLQHQVLLAVSLGVLGMTGMLYVTDAHVFQRFLGGFNPLAVFLLTVALGAVLFSLLLSRCRFAVYKKGNRKGLYLSSGLAAIFAAIMILVDSKIRFPADLNILFPESLLFYPAIGYLVEILFHVLPLTVLLVFLSAIVKGAHRERIVWISIAIVALLEPLYQTLFIASPNWFPPWAQAYVAVHIFLINLFQLLIFKQYDFVSMYVFRLVYYLFWHIGWGYIRLRVLF